MPGLGCRSVSRVFDLPSMHQALGLIPQDQGKLWWPVPVIPGQAETGRSEVQDHPHLHNRLEIRLPYMTPCLKKERVAQTKVLVFHFVFNVAKV